MRPLAFKVVLYEAVRRAAQAQKEALRSDDLGTFYNLLQAREQLLNRIDGIDTTRSSPETVDLDRRDRAEATRLVKDILSLDQETEQMLVQKINDTAGALSTIQTGKSALNGYKYLAPATVGNYFVDRLS